jgi:hypothetical protein
MDTKKAKKDLRKDTVNSKHFHVGIELELIAKCEGGDSEHYDDACYDSRREGWRDHLESMSIRELIVEVTGEYVSRDVADPLKQYLDIDTMINDSLDSYMENSSCDDSECSYYSQGSNSIRESIEEDLKELTGNNSIKVVEDGSITHDSDEVDAEVCWNYFASKETIKDNSTILKYLTNKGTSFNTSCGLHINLNNYLNIEHTKNIPTEKLDFLFDFVGKSRRTSNYCNNYAIGNTKYSMIYNQDDRLEFRFFSPTLEATKLNYYVQLANVVYRRLAGQEVTLSKKVMKYFLDKMMNVNGLSFGRASDTLQKLNVLKSYAELCGDKKPTQDTEKQDTLLEVDTLLLTDDQLALIQARNCLSYHSLECLCVHGQEIILNSEIEVA